MNTVISKDGTRIVYCKQGSGPAVILVDGAFCSKDFGPMPKIAELLAKDFTVFTYDRRGRGESGDTKPYTVTKEIDDLKAIVMAAGGSAYLFGISSGAALSIKAVTGGLNIEKLVLFEPPFLNKSKENRPPRDSEKQLNAMISEGRQADAVKFYMKKIMGMPAIIAFIIRLTPHWKKMKANANSLPYDAAVMGDFYLPEKEVAAITIPTLVIDSLQSPDFLRAACREVVQVLPNAQQKSLKGKIHDVPAKTLVPVLTGFYNVR
ncbi:MAG: alpha/beta fold hydrolase [Mucilaginibacter sp.]